MNGHLDNFLVCGALLVALGYALYSFGPKSWRRRSLHQVAAWLDASPESMRLRAIAARFRQAATAGAAGSCGDCAGCARPPAAEVRVPLAAIHRRR